VRFGNGYLAEVAQRTHSPHCLEGEVPMPGSKGAGTVSAFDPIVVGRLECDAWANYYRRQWISFLRAAVGLVREGFSLGPVRSLVGAWHVLRANQAWAPYPDNDPGAARAHMRRFYALVFRNQPRLDPGRAAMLEVEWWRVHRAHQHAASPDWTGFGPIGVTVGEDALVSALVALYSYLYEVPADRVRAAAELRMRAMDVSDRWVAAGCDVADPLLAQERRLLVDSYTVLRDAVDRAGSAPS
jgi:hypothetical protein